MIIYFSCIIYKKKNNMGWIYFQLCIFLQNCFFFFFVNPDYSNQMKHRPSFMFDWFHSQEERGKNQEFLSISHILGLC